MKKRYVDFASFCTNKVSFSLSGNYFTLTPFFRDKINIRKMLLAIFLKRKNGFLYSLETGNLFLESDFFSLIKRNKFLKSWKYTEIFHDYPKIKGISLKCFLRDDNIGSISASSRVFIEDDINIAFFKAFGEALERYSTYYDPSRKNIFYPKIKMMNVEFLFDQLPKFTDIQLEKNKKLFDSRNDLVSVPCIHVSSLTGSRRRYLPLSCFFWGDKVYARGKTFFHSSSSGCAGGLTYKNAIISSLYENIERDHFLLYWFSKIPPRIIDSQTIEDTFQKYIIDVQKTYNLEVYFLDLRYDTNIPVCSCVIIDPILNIVSIGSKASASGIDSLKGAFLESLDILSGTRRMENYSGEDFQYFTENEIYSDKITQDIRRKLYNSKSGIIKIKNTFLSGTSISFADYNDSSLQFQNEQDEFQSLINIFKNLIKKNDGYHVYVYEFDSLILRNVSYFCVKTFIPSFLKLHLIESLATPVCNRLFQFSKDKGYPLLSQSDINTAPHFFS